MLANQNNIVSYLVLTFENSSSESLRDLFWVLVFVISDIYLLLTL